ncbi:hypothetical protein COLO4_24172 [Corchorus olitorius]|uniref:Peroxisomal membrane protein PEX14 n=1 Tax=Corchorus olitorius TaxID=93759 RepID=A0A1R3ICB3_9ROSI|nr:hypothetical protein COLO4_24172 [Corchorus olitorius]
MSNFQAVNFFKVYYSHYTSQTMCIPPNSVVLPKGSMCGTATLRNSSKNQCSWHVELKQVAGNMYFERGWTKFVAENTLNDGDILVFTYVGSSLFDVTIEGDDIELKSEEEEEIEVLATSNKKTSKGCRGEGSASKNNKGTVEDVELYIARNVNQLNPCFVVKGRKHRDNELYVPSDVTKRYNLNLEDEEEITFIDPLGRKMIGKESLAEFKRDKLRETPTNSVSQNSEPMREDLVEMATKFLLHPSVSRSPVSHRRSFLEKRGLTSDEIDEAFRRVPDPNSAGTFGKGMDRNQDVQSKAFASVQQQGTGQSSQPLAASIVTASPSSRFSWSYAIFSLLLLILSGAGTSMLLKKFLVPRLKSCICKVVLEEDDDKRENSKLTLSKETIEAAKAAAAASVNAAKASLEILQSKKEEGRYLDVLIQHLGSHVAELGSMSKTIKRLEAASHKLPGEYVQHASQNGLSTKLQELSIIHRDDPGNSVSSSMKFKPSGISSYDSSVRPSSAPLMSSAGQHPKSYMEILDMIQRGEKPPGIKDIDDSPPNPDQPLPNPRITPRLKASHSEEIFCFEQPWEIAQPQNSNGYTPEKGKAQLNGDNMYQFVDGREILKPLVVQDSRSQNIYAPSDGHVSFDFTIQNRSCGIAQTECPSVRIVIQEKVGLASYSELNAARSCSGHGSLCPIPYQTTTTCKLIKVHAVTHSPSPILSLTEKASQPSHVSRVIDSDQQSCNEVEASRELQNSAQLMDDFLELAKDNTKKDLETCGVLGAFLEKGTYYVTTLIIPKQESTSNSTHPSQSCFMSSIDLHTQYSYQVMVPEAFAIVVAPTDNSRNYGIFRISDPSGMSVLKECQEKGSQFHSHSETENGHPLYEHCTHVYKNSNLRFEIFDLR